MPEGRATGMIARGAVWLLAAVLSVAMAAPLQAKSVEQDLLAQINQERAKVGCGALKVSAPLRSAALLHARAMAEQNFFGHIGPQGDRFFQRIAAQGYQFRKSAENLAGGQHTAAAVVAGWMASTAHRRNIVDCSYVDTGIALVYQADDAPLHGYRKGLRWYWVQEFAHP